MPSRLCRPAALVLLLSACASADTGKVPPDDACAGPLLPWFIDADGDGYGDPATPTEACTAAPGQVADATDCDDTRADVHPDALDACEDGLDGNCDGVDTTCGSTGTTSVKDAAARIYSDEPTTDLGRIVRVGDVDGDGQQDVVTATFLADYQKGGAFTLPGPIVVSGTAQDLGRRAGGAGIGDGVGRALAVGDLDGDGIDDIGLGSPYGARSGMVVVYGPHTGDISLADATLLRGPSASYAGHGVDIGDVNADGAADAVVGAYYAASNAGAVYVAFGPVTGNLDLEADADATLTGEASGVYAGRIVSGGGDLNGDGVGDLVIACLGSLGAPGSGGFYVVHGPPVDLDLSAARPRGIRTRRSRPVRQHRQLRRGGCAAALPRRRLPRPARRTNLDVPAGPIVGCQRNRARDVGAALPGPLRGAADHEGVSFPELGLHRRPADGTHRLRRLGAGELDAAQSLVGLDLRRCQWRLPALRPWGVGEAAERGQR